MSASPLYLLTRMDIADIDPESDVIDNDRYLVLANDDDIVKQVQIAMGGFADENPHIVTYEQWKHIGRGYDFRIYSAGIEIFRASTLLVSPRIRQAILLILKHHGNQKRKIDNHPYLEHPLIVGNVLWRNGYVPTTVAAGFCHDLLEDTPCTAEEIRRACGSETLRIVRSVSQENISDWDKKKKAYISSVEKGGSEAVAVSLVDKIHNAETLIAAHQSMGPSVWNKFNRGKKDKINFEKRVYAMATKQNFPLFLNEYRRLIDQLDQLADS